MNQAAKGAGRVAAFFDLDGTLIASPSLERRFFAMLRYRNAIPLENYFLWLARAVTLAPRGVAAMPHANKMYLRGMRADWDDPRTSSTGVFPSFFPNALDRIAWHAKSGHTILLITGTLAPLARGVSLALTVRLAARGTTATIGVCATQLEETRGRWTGRIVGEAMYAQGKARAMWRLAASAGFDLSRCYAYGDTASDRWMLGAVGRPAAVNPSRELARIARLRDWPVLWWKEKANRAQTTAKEVFAKEEHSKTCRSAAANTKSESLG